jgi:hypothetical protein
MSTNMTAHFKEQVLLGNVKHIRAKRLTVNLRPGFSGEVWVSISLDDGDGLPLREIGPVSVSATSESSVHVYGFSEAFDVRLA